jgi:serine/threonine protein kinase
MLVSSAVMSAVQIAAALTAAHGACFANGALSPAAILLNEEWRVRVLDFGVAQLLGREARPEEDIIAFGAILYEILTGRRPGKEPEPLGKTVPCGLAELVDRCMAGDSSAAQIKSELDDMCRVH